MRLGFRAGLGTQHAAGALVGYRCQLPVRPETQDRDRSALYRGRGRLHARRTRAPAARQVWRSSRRDAQCLRQDGGLGSAAGSIRAAGRVFEGIGMMPYYTAIVTLLAVAFYFFMATRVTVA